MAVPTVGSILSSASTNAMLQTGAMTDKIVLDSAFGSDLTHFGVGNAGQRYDIRHGVTAGTMVTTDGSTFKVNRVQNITSTTEGAEFIQYSAIVGITNNPTTNRVMSVGVSGIAASASTVSPPGSTLNPDACGIVGHGTISSGGTGVAFGAHLEANSQSATGTVSVLELQARNATGSAGTYNAAGISSIQALQIGLNNNDGGSGINFGNAFGYKWNAGIAFKSQNTGAINTTTGASIRDDGQGFYSYLINGTHTGAAIAVADTAGKVLIGVTSSAGAHKMLVKSNDAANAALEVRGTTSQSANAFSVSDVAATSLFGIGPAGSVVISGDTAGGGHLHLVEQSANAATPTSNVATRIYMKGDKVVILFNNGGTARYFTLDLTQSGATATWAQSTSAP